MTYSDFINQNPDDSVFFWLDKQGALQFLGTLTPDLIKQLDTAFLFDNSNRCFTCNNSNMITVMGAPDFMNMATTAIKTKFSDKWQAVFDQYTSANSPLGTDTKEQFNQTTNAVGSTQNNGDTTNQVSAYDSEDFVNDAKITTDGKQNINNNENVDYTKTITSFNVLNQIIDQLTNRTLYDTIYSDIRSYLFKTTI